MSLSNVRFACVKHTLEKSGVVSPTRNGILFWKISSRLRETTILNAFQARRPQPSNQDGHLLALPGLQISGARNKQQLYIAKLSFCFATRAVSDQQVLSKRKGFV